jgi:manganese efflux pump family protein
MTLPIIEIIGIGIGLSMDAFSVSVINGSLIKNIKFAQALRIAFSFGLFQAIMPVLGWAAGLAFVRYIEAFDHWIAFGLLSFIGGKMIWESFSKKGECREDMNCLKITTLLMLSLATSIDALAVGLSFSMLEVSIAVPVLLIGLITFIICMAGIYIGKTIGHFFENRLELIGGLILIGIGLKILLDHLLAGPQAPL